MTTPADTDGQHAVPGKVWSRDGVPAFLAYLVLAVVVTYPLVGQLGGSIVGRAYSTDAFGHIWHSWWFSSALSAGLNPYQVHSVLFPAGSTDLLVKSGPCFNAALTAPFQLLFGVVASYNLSALLLLALNGFAAYRLTLALVGQRPAAAVAGVALAVNPYLLSELQLTRMDQFSAGWCLLFVLLLLRTMRRPGLRAPLGAALVLLLATVSFLGYVQLLFILSLFLLAFELLSRRVRLDRALVGRLALLGGVALLLVAPMAWAFLSKSAGVAQPPQMRVAFPWGAPSSLDALTMAERIIVDNAIHPLRLLLGGGEGLPPGPVPRFALVTGGLALIGLFRRRRVALRWGGVALLFALLSLGPYLVLDPSEPDGPRRLLPLPGLLFYKLFPLAERFRFPGRFLFVFWIAVTVLSAHGGALLLTWASRKRKALVLALTGVLCLGLLVESGARGFGSAPAPLSSFPEVPRYYREVLADQPDMAILAVPTGTRKPSREEEEASPLPMWQAHQMLYQAFHQHRMAGGLWVAFHPPRAYKKFIQQNSLLANTLRWQTDAGAEPFAVHEEDLRDMVRLGFGAVVLHEGWLHPPNAAVLRQALTRLFGPPREFASDRMAVFDLRGRGPARNGAERILLAPTVRPSPTEQDEAERFARSPSHGRAAELRRWSEDLERGVQRPAASAKDHADLVGFLLKYRLLRRASRALKAGLAAHAKAGILWKMQADLYQARGLPGLAIEAHRRARSLDPSLWPPPAALQLPAVERPVVAGP